ncbi:MAG: hypothetical protein KF716_29380 [Anaerolineae bacterium]|nr:hypothetical protein [Anaerolineae bacterium]
MNQYTEQRIAIAKRRIQPYTADPNFKAIIITGSVAEDKTDDTSDIDIILYYETPLTEEAFQQVCDAAKATGGGVHNGTAAEGFAIYEYIDDVRVDLGFNPLSEIEEILTGVLEKADTTLINQLIAGGVLKSIVLHGEAWAAGWKERLSHYPTALGEAMVNTYLRFYPRWVVKRMGVDRDERLWMIELCLNASQNLVAVLCGLNNLYHPGKWKGIASTLKAMHIKPERFPERLEGLFRAPLDDAATELHNLTLEVMALVEQHMPQVDISQTKQRYLINRLR